MKSFSFARNVLAALVLSTVGWILLTTLTPLFGRADSLRLVLLVTGLGYVIFLLQQLAPRFGISLVICGCLIVAVLLLLVNPPLLLWVVTLTAMTWLIRCVFRYQRFLPVALDAGLTLLALCGGFTVMLYTHSIWLSLWSYFLLLAFSVALPARHSHSEKRDPDGEDFQQAQLVAESALRRLQKSHSFRSY